jgi:hypothetical protein
VRPAVVSAEGHALSGRAPVRSRKRRSRHAVNREEKHGPDLLEPYFGARRRISAPATCDAREGEAHRSSTPSGPKSAAALTQMQPVRGRISKRVARSVWELPSAVAAKHAATFSCREVSVGGSRSNRQPNNAVGCVGRNAIAGLHACGEQCGHEVGGDCVKTRIGKAAEGRCRVGGSRLS